MKHKLTLPVQYEGIKKDVAHARSYSTLAEAETCFTKAKNKLLNVNQWGDVADIGSASFQLTSDTGQAINGVAQVGNYIKIDIPAPKLSHSKGYDWVVIETIEEAKDSIKDSEGIMIVVRPTHQPFDDIHATTHFFDSDATSSFLIEREGTLVTASEHARNEIPNSENENLADKIRNIFVAVAAVLGLSDVQWKKLVRGLLDCEK
jgi:hypothetical protein